MTKQMTNEELLAALRGFQDSEEPQYSSLAALAQKSAPAPIPAELSIDQELKDAESRRDNQAMWANLAKAGSQFGASYAGATKPVDTSVFDSISKDSDNYVSDIKNRQTARVSKLDEEKKSREAETDKELVNPNSSISQAARERAKKMMPELAKIKNFDNMSAAQLEQFGFKMNNPQAQGPSFQQTRYVDPVTGNVKLGLFNTRTGEIVDTGKNAGFANQFREDPTTGNIIALSPSAPSTAPVGVTGQKPLQAPTPQGKPGQPGMSLDLTKQPQVPEAFQIRESLNPLQRKSVAENTNLYLKDTEKNRDAVVAASNVRSLLQAPADGKMDYDILRAIQNQLARGNGEVGAMTENDVAPYGGKPTIMGKLQRWTAMQTVGQLPPEDRKLLSDLSLIMEKNARNGIKMQSQPYVANVQRDTGLQGEQAFTLLGGEASTIPSQQIPAPQASSASGLNPEQRKQRILELQNKIKSGN